MKILVGMPAADSWGGPAACEPPFVDALRSLGVDVTEEVYVYGNKDRPTPLVERVRRVLKTAFRFRQILKNESFDIIHLNTSFDLKTLLRDTISLTIMRPGNAKLFLKIHGSEAEKMHDAGRTKRYLINYLRKRVHGLGLLSSEEKANFLHLGFSPEEAFIVKNAVTLDLSLSRNDGTDTKNNGDTVKILFVSRFIPTKGLIETIRACAILKRDGVHFKLSCVGDGEIRREAEETVTELGLSDNVSFTGYITESEVSANYLTNDIFVFPTRHIEGFPLVLFKAAAAGLPIVTTKIRAASDYLTDPENCLFTTGEVEDVAAKISILVNDPELRARMCEANLKFGETLRPENIAREYLTVYEKMLSAGRENG